MHSDPRSTRRPVRDRLGSRSVPPPLSSLRRPASLVRPSHTIAKRESTIMREKYHVVNNAVPKDASASKPRKDALTSPEGSFRPEVQKSAQMHSQTPKEACFVEGKGGSSKEPAGDKKPIGVRKLTVATFLEKLGLSKFLVTFQAEEVDMFALRHMNDEDLKSIGLPMGPRKKVLYGITRLNAKSKQC